MPVLRSAIAGNNNLHILASYTFWHNLRHLILLRYDIPPHLDPTIVRNNNPSRSLRLPVPSENSLRVFHLQPPFQTQSLALCSALFRAAVPRVPPTVRPVTVEQVLVLPMHLQHHPQSYPLSADHHTNRDPCICLQEDVLADRAYHLFRTLILITCCIALISPSIHGHYGRLTVMKTITDKS